MSDNPQPTTHNSQPTYDICVLGLGYIGLPTSSIFATKGKKVLGVDVVPSVVETINNGKIHIEEPDLDILVRAAVQSGSLKAALKPEVAEVYIIAVPTPFIQNGDGSKIPDLKYVEAASRSIAKVAPDNALIILESTSPVGTTEKVKEWVEEERGCELGVESCEVGGTAQRTTHNPQPKKNHNPQPTTLMYVHCPERILPGQMLKELVTNDRIAGGLTPEAAERARELYRVFCTADIYLTDARTAELAKLTENAFRDVNIAFANELSMICDHLGIDVWELIQLANRHPRVNILQPGPGVGGHCIAVDPWFIVDAAPEQARLIRTAREVNNRKPEYVIEQVRAKAERFKKAKVACFGLAFKANVDDLRESPALQIVRQLAKESDVELLLVEPHIRELPEDLRSRASFVDADIAVRDADILVLLVDHREFTRVPKTKLAEKVVLDTRGIWRS